MAKRSSTTKQTKTAPTRLAARTPAAEAAGVVERQVLAFAEQLGYVAGSIQSKAGGLMDRETLSRQVSGVRDGAKHLSDADPLEALILVARVGNGCEARVVANLLQFRAAPAK